MQKAKRFSAGFVEGEQTFLIQGKDAERRGSTVSDDGDDTDGFDLAKYVIYKGFIACHRWDETHGKSKRGSQGSPSPPPGAALKRVDSLLRTEGEAVVSDDESATPDAEMIAKLHKTFSNRKLMKQAQEQDPLAGRGFKNAVLLLGHYDGFRLDMLGQTESNSALLLASVKKVVVCQAIGTSVYVILHRGGLGDNKFVCHCLVTKSSEEAAEIQHFLTEIVRVSKLPPSVRSRIFNATPTLSGKKAMRPLTMSEETLGQGTPAAAPLVTIPSLRQRRGSIRDNRTAAKQRTRSVPNIGEESFGVGDTAAAAQDTLVEEEEEELIEAFSATFGAVAEDDEWDTFDDDLFDDGVVRTPLAADDDEAVFGFDGFAVDETVK